MSPTEGRPSAPGVSVARGGRSFPECRRPSLALAAFPSPVAVDAGVALSVQMEGGHETHGAFFGACQDPSFRRREALVHRHHVTVSQRRCAVGLRRRPAVKRARPRQDPSAPQDAGRCIDFRPSASVGQGGRAGQPRRLGGGEGARVRWGCAGNRRTSGVIGRAHRPETGGGRRQAHRDGLGRCSRARDAPFAGRGGIPHHR